MTPLLMAAYCGCPQAVRLLLDAGADKTIGDADGLPIDQVCNHRDADQANKAEIIAMLE